MHNLLKRQLKRHLRDEVPESMRGFVEAVDAAYESSDQDRAMLERSLDLSSEELHQANAKMRSVLRAFPDLFFRIDLEGRILECKGGRREDFLLPAESLVGKRLQDVPLQEAGARIAATIGLVKRTRLPAHLEYSLTIEGKVLHYEARLVPLSETELFGIIRNITGRKEAEEAVERSLALLRATIESSTDGILVRALDGRILVYNRRFVELCRIPADVLASRSHAVMLDWAKNEFPEPEKFLEDIRRIYADPGTPTFHVLETRDGRIFERHTQPYRQGGGIVGVVTNLREVTERKRLERAVTQSEKMSAVGQLAAGVAHELNNPLGVILGFAQGLIRRLSGDGAPEAMPLRSIEREARRCQVLIQQLLTFSRVRGPGVSEEDIQEVVDGALALVGTQAVVRRVTLERRFEAPLPRVPLDRNQIQQVVINLCTNAIDAMPDGGTLTVALKSSGDPGRARRVELSVRDTGLGMSPETSSRIFEPFFTTKEVGKGTGLGLALVHEIVKKHGGTVDVETAPGRGSAFTIRLPLQSPALPKGGEAMRDGAGRRGSG